MEEKGNQLKSLLSGQQFETEEERQTLLEAALRKAEAYAETTGGIAVLSDWQANVCHICSGLFGRTLGLPAYSQDTSSAFESVIFDRIYKDELTERHILELRFFQFLKSVPLEDKTSYYASCMVHFRQEGATSLPVLHTTRYVECSSNGSAWFGLCTYNPFPGVEGAVRACIINSRTGQAVSPNKYAQIDSLLLSRRQREVLALLAKGIGSKQIADRLCVSVHTVNRHRQDILTALQAPNTAAAVEMGLRMGMI